MNGDDPTPAAAAAAPAPPPTAPDDVGLPYRKWSAVFAGAAVGVVIRIAFGLGLSPMDGAFVLLVPAVVAAVTSVLDERRGRVGLGVHVFHGALANLLFVAGTLAILIEGWICAIVVLPLMMAIGAVTGLVVGLLCRVGRFPRQAAFGLVALPFALAAIEERLPPPDLHETVERRIAIAAPPERVWQAIHAARDIRPEEVGHGLAYRIGVPTPIAGITEATPEGRVRRVTMGKGIRFDQVVVDWEENRRVRFVYRFDDDSVPRGALDDHVRIGGRHFDLVDTEYALQPRPGGGTELAIRIRYRVSTGFNAYAGLVGRLLLGNFGETILDFYRARAEAAA